MSWDILKQIWLSLHVDDYQFGYINILIIDLEKKKPYPDHISTNVLIETSIYTGPIFL
jgi:hypothetical protein